MKVLVVTNMYPDINPECSYEGIFVKEQVDCLNKLSNIQCDSFIIKGFESKLNYLFDAFKIFFKVSFNHFDVIHVHYGLSGLFVLLNPFKSWKNVVLTLHGGDILSKQGKYIQNFITKAIVKRVGNVITLNDEMNGIVSKINHNFTMLPCGVDDELFNSCYSANRKNIIIFPGSMNRQVKNFPLFNEIFQEYKKIDSEVEFTELDGLSRDEIAVKLSQSKLLLMTSISEGSPQIIKEALSSDLAIISTDVGDVKSVVGNTLGTRIISSKETPLQIANSINTVIKDALDSPTNRRARVFTKELTQNLIMKKLLNIYERVMNND
ncbi:glycosyltransferase [Thalassotalea sp. ND16A]|uniref:glycosyltransferase n=1 Tax=Thalassotalea sp. ND16A TaxID=1535422 RepID=UPI00051A2D64|nr:glycosyltransferase [Thalassotalea sp. ND16A]KGJ90199.1 hypothetical protein ND16A_2049 [Thalassotalea sp. ND16A]